MLYLPSVKLGGRPLRGDCGYDLVPKRVDHGTPRDCANARNGGALCGGKKNEPTSEGAGAILSYTTKNVLYVKIFEEASHGIAPTNSDLLHILRRVAEDGTRPFRGWLGFFSSTQCASIASIGSVSWSTVV